MTTLRPLTYDDTPRRRRWSAKWLVVLGLLTAMGAGWRWWPVVWQRLTVWTYAVQVSDHLIQPNVLVIDSKNHVALPCPRQWSNFCKACEGCGNFELAVIFLGGRTAPNGSRKVVEIGFDDLLMTGGNAISWRTFDRNRIGMLTASAVDPGYECLRDSLDPGVACYSGVADPVDPSHFTCREVRSNGIFILDGYLMNDGTVRLESRPSSFSGRPAELGKKWKSGHKSGVSS